MLILLLLVQHPALSSKMELTCTSSGCCWFKGVDERATCLYHHSVLKSNVLFLLQRPVGCYHSPLRMTTCSTSCKVNPPVKHSEKMPVGVLAVPTSVCPGIEAQN